MATPVIVTDKTGVRRAARMGRKRRIARVPRARYPRLIELSYRKELWAIIPLLRRLAMELMIPRIAEVVAAAHVPKTDARMDSWDDQLTTVANRIKSLWLATKRHEILAAARAAGTSISVASGKATRTAFAAGLGVQPALAEPWLQPLLQQFAEQNATAVSTAVESFSDKLAAAVAAGVRDGQRAEQIAEKIEGDFGGRSGSEVEATRKRLGLIARDQVGSLNGDITRARQVDLGVERFIWRTSQDERVRPSHVERDGETFEWGKSMEAQLRAKGMKVDTSDGFPGRPILCRCVAEPVLSDLLSEQSDV